MHDEGVTYRREGMWTWLDAGWRPAPGTNKSTGCAIVLGKKFKPANIWRTWTAPVPGRGIAVKVSGTFCDLLVISVYFPPHVAGGAAAAYSATCRKLC